MRFEEGQSAVSVRCLDDDLPANGRPKGNRSNGRPLASINKHTGAHWIPTRERPRQSANRRPAPRRTAA